MKQVGKIPVTISLQGKIRRDDILIFPGVSCILISWKAAKSYAFCLPSTQPYPKRVPQTKQDVYPEMKSAYSMYSTGEQLTKEFPSVFSGQISAMEELFIMSLMDSVKVPRSVPFAY